MKPGIWLLAADDVLVDLEAALRADGLDVARTTADAVEQVVAAAYDGRGLLLVDARTPAGLAVLAERSAAALPVLALAEDAVELPVGVLRLPVDLEVDMLHHHVREVLNQPSNLRRHPRVRVSLPAAVDGAPGWKLRDASLYGMWIEPAGDLDVGRGVEVTVVLEDGASVALSGRVLAVRGEGAAVRCRPTTDEDLLLWIHLILGGLATSPLHADADPFGPLFE